MIGRQGKVADFVHERQRGMENVASDGDRRENGSAAARRLDNAQCVMVSPGIG